MKFGASKKVGGFTRNMSATPRRSFLTAVSSFLVTHVDVWHSSDHENKLDILFWQYMQVYLAYQWIADAFCGIHLGWNIRLVLSEIFGFVALSWIDIFYLQKGFIKEYGDKITHSSPYYKFSNSRRSWWNATKSESLVEVLDQSCTYHPLLHKGRSAQ